MMRNLWLCSLFCVLAAAGPFHTHRAYAQDDVVDFDDAALNEDAVENELESDENSSGNSKSASADSSADEGDFEDEFKDDEPKKDEVANKAEQKDEDESLLEDEKPKEEATANAEDELEPAPPDAKEPEIAQPEPEPEPEPVTQAPEPTPEPAPQVAQTNNEPDLEYEARLYDIYVNYTSTKTPEDQWRGLVGQRQDEHYKIQKNDNLWDISQTLFGDGNYWPKIWSLNSTITNPHVIEPGNTIRFLLGDESGPPAFTVSEAESEPETESESVSAPNQTRNEEAVSDEPEIPPPTKAFHPVLKKLPPSLPNWQNPDEIARKFDDAGISYGRRKIADIKDNIQLAAYISESAPQPLGEVTEIETGFNMASALQYIYVRMSPGQGEVGDKYLSVLNKGELKAPRGIVDDKFLGYGIEVLGEIQLIEKVDSEKRDAEKEGDVFRALVTKTVSPVSIGSSLIIGKIEDVDLSEKGRQSQAVSQIIGGQFSTDRKLYGPQSFAFLDRGSSDGFAVGQILPIRVNRKARDTSSKVLANIRSIGWLKIVKTTENFSTAIILRSWGEIVTGDYTGAADSMNMSKDSSGEVESGTKTSLNEILDDSGEKSDNDLIDDSDDSSDFSDDAE